MRLTSVKHGIYGGLGGGLVFGVREGGLGDVFRPRRIETRTPSRSEDLGEIGLDHRLDGAAIARPDPRRQVGVVECRGGCAVSGAVARVRLLASARV